MDRREFSAAAAGALALGLPGLASAQRRPQDGRDYRRLESAAPVEAPRNKIEVVEFFWYGCPHCHSFEPKLVPWSAKLPPDVVLRRVPVAFRDEFVPHQRLYYALEAMGKVNELQSKVFHAIHVERKPTDTEASILDFAQQNGLDRAKFQELYNSFAISTKARRAKQLQDQYEVDGVPALGVAGRYYTDATLAGGMDNALRVVDYLVGETRKAR